MSLHIGHGERGVGNSQCGALWPPTPKSLLSLKTHLWPCEYVCVCVWGCDWQLPGFSLLSKVPHPLLKYVWLRPSPTRQPISLDSGLLLVLSCRNTECWLWVETDKEALGVFIETLIYQNNNNLPPHRERERDRHASKLTLGFTSQRKKCPQWVRIVWQFSAVFLYPDNNQLKFSLNEWKCLTAYCIYLRSLLVCKNRIYNSIFRPLFPVLKMFSFSFLLTLVLCWC